MKYVAFIGLFLVGGIVGYFVGVQHVYETGDELTDTTDYISEVVEDNSNHKHNSGSSNHTDENSDSSAFNDLDTLQYDEVLDTLTDEISNSTIDTSDVEELNIKRDRMISSRRVQIVYLDEPEEKDSVIKEMLGIKENRPAEMILQFWESPLGYSGYKLSRNTLVLYGLSEQFKYTVYYKQNLHYLSTKELFYVMKETSDFVPFKSANRSVILDD